MKKIGTGTAIRTVLLALALINQVLVMFGFEPLPVSDEQAYDLLSMVFLIATSIWSWWKNNNFTKESQQVQQELDQRKLERKYYRSDEQEDYENNSNGMGGTL